MEHWFVFLLWPFGAMGWFNIMQELSKLFHNGQEKCLLLKLASVNCCHNEWLQWRMSKKKNNHCSVSGLPDSWYVDCIQLKKTPKQNRFCFTHNKAFFGCKMIKEFCQLEVGGRPVSIYNFNAKYKECAWCWDVIFSYLGPFFVFVHLYSLFRYRKLQSRCFRV